ncbi:MAG TPA: hypothetical protein VIN75_11990 [Burkholderiaceae bacterium]
MSLTKYVAAAVAALSFAGAAHADALYTSSAYGSIANTPDINWCSSCGGQYQVLNPFSLSQSSVVTGLDIGATAWYGMNWNLTVQVWDSTHTNVLDTATFASGSYTTNVLNANVNELTFTLPSWNLAAGNYYVSVVDPTDFAIASYNNTGTDFQYQIGIGQHDTSGAYVVSGVSAVPEGSELSLMLGGLALVGTAVRRRRLKA